MNRLVLNTLLEIIRDSIYKIIPHSENLSLIH